MSTDIWSELELSDKLADDLRNMVRLYESQAARSLQKELGPSQIGNPCTRCLARYILGVPIQREHNDPWCRIIGTAVHAWLDEAAAAHNVATDTARYYPELRVYPDARLLPIGGSCDLYDAHTKTVIDHKVVGAVPLRKYRANGPGINYRRQIQLYGRGYVNAGQEVRNVAVAFWLRGGRLSDLYVHVEDYDPVMAQQALDRYEVIRNVAHQIGPDNLGLLPTDPDCWDCGGLEKAEVKP